MRCVLSLLFVGAVVLGCGPDLPEGIDAEAQRTWEQYREAPDPTTFEHFIAKNRLAAQAHGNPWDGLGALYQVRALEAQADQALLQDDARLAETVSERLYDLEEGELLSVLEEVLPGATERLLSAKARLDEHFK